MLCFSGFELYSRWVPCVIRSGLCLVWFLCRRKGSVNLTGRFATKSFRYRSFRYKVVSLRVVLLQSRFAASCPHSAEVDFTNEL